MKKNWAQAIIWIVAFQVVGLVLGLLTKDNIMSWYQYLNKSNLTPPSIAFSIVWPILYVMIALAGYSLWRQRKDPDAKIALYFYSAQLIMNWLWTPLFFQLHYIGFSFVWILILTLLTLITIYLTRNKFKFACLMLVPYFLWLLFASYLNGTIWLLN
ncbi:MAG: TspO/MBR family protein [Legionella sp.]|jgi:tryptophan-rich sensory protein